VNDRARSLQGVLWELRHSPTPQQGLDAADVLAAAAARVVELETALREVARPYCENYTTGVGSCFRAGRTELHDERGSYISCCHSCFAARVLDGTPEEQQ
jgi:hypothetical protein